MLYTKPRWAPEVGARPSEGRAFTHAGFVGGNRHGTVRLRVNVLMAARLSLTVAGARFVSA